MFTCYLLLLILLINFFNSIYTCAFIYFRFARIRVFVFWGSIHVHVLNIYYQKNGFRQLYKHECLIELV